MFVSVGFGNYVSTGQILAICRADSSPMKRMISEARSSQTAVDATQGRKTKCVIVLTGGQLLLSALLPETIAGRCNGLPVKEAVKDGEEETEPEEGE